MWIRMFTDVHHASHEVVLKSKTKSKPKSRPRLAKATSADDIHLTLRTKGVTAPRVKRNIPLKGTVWDTFGHRLLAMDTNYRTGSLAWAKEFTESLAKQMEECMGFDQHNMEREGTTLNNLKLFIAGLYEEDKRKKGADFFEYDMLIWNALFSIMPNFIPESSVFDGTRRGS